MGQLDQTTCDLLCAPALSHVSWCEVGTRSEAGETPVTCSSYCPTGWKGRPPAARAALPVAGRWARAAMCERASAFAFLELAEELELLGAPAHLIRWCHRAATEEVRHGELMAAKAAEHGEEVPVVRVRRVPPRSAARLAVDNMRDGCVGEAAGVVEALLDEEVPPSIAGDEAGHASLAWAIHRWLWPQLDPSERQAVQAEREASLAAVPLAGDVLVRFHRAVELTARSIEA